MQTRAPTRRLHLDFVDGLRGLSALFVMAHHIWQFSISDADPVPPSWFRVASVFKYGSFAVAVFLVVSGFCLMLPVLRDPSLRLDGGLGGFTKRRAARILPPYYGALAFSVLLIASFSVLRRGSGTPWDITLPNFEIDKEATHLLLIHNWFDSLRWGLNPPMWTVALEVQIYVVFALVLLPCWRRFNGMLTVVVGFALGLVLTLLGSGRVSPWMVGLFALGMAAAWLAVTPGHERLARVPWGGLAVAASVLVVVAVVAAQRFHVGIAGPFAEETLVGLATSAGLVGMSRRQLAGVAPSATARLLRLPPARFVGTISYSVYLVHYPIVALAALLVVRRADPSVPVAFIVLALICTPVVLAVSYGMHVLFERPYLKRRVTGRPEMSPSVSGI